MGTYRSYRPDPAAVFDWRTLTATAVGTVQGRAGADATTIQDPVADAGLGRRTAARGLHSAPLSDVHEVVLGNDHPEVRLLSLGAAIAGVRA
ncbi:MAG: hypothetical protein R2716_10360 [Microthrixaceae bacterium]